MMQYGGFYSLTAESISLEDYLTGNMYAVTYLSSTVQSYMFANCKSLAAVNLPNTTDVLDYAFKDCSSLQVVLGHFSYIGTQAFYNTAISTISLDQCSTIMQEAFGSCSNLVFSSNLTLSQCLSIGPSVFIGHSEIIGGSFPLCSYVASSAFTGTGFSRVTADMFASNVSIHRACFMSCTQLEYLSLNIVCGMDYTFAYCENLIEASLPKCSALYYCCFFNCTNLASVYIPLCQTLDTSAFQSCYNLSYIDLGSCSIIGESAFYHCSTLKKVILRGSSVASVGSYTFAGSPMTSYRASVGWGSIVVPSSLYLAYKSARYWSAMSYRITSIFTS